MSHNIVSMPKLQKKENYCNYGKQLQCNQNKCTPILYLNCKMSLVIYYFIPIICKEDKTVLSSFNRDHLKITKWIFCFLILVEYCNNKSLQSIRKNNFIINAQIEFKRTKNIC